MMAVLYRCDINLLGGRISAVNIKKNRLIYRICDAELVIDGEKHPCVATFYPSGAYKLNAMDDPSVEKDLYEKFMLILRNDHKELFRYLLRDILKILSGICILVFFIFSAYYCIISAGREYPYPMLYFHFVGFLGSALVNYLLNFV